MELRGKRIEYGVSIEVNESEIFESLKKKAIGPGYKKEVYLNETGDKLIDTYYYHGSMHDDDIICEDPEKIETYKLIVELEKRFKNIK